MIRLFRIFLVFTLLLSFGNPRLVFSQEKEEKEAIQSLREQREQTLRYGIDSQVLELIDKLQEEENHRYNDRLLEIFTERKNQNIRQSIVDFFDKIESEALVERAKKLLIDDWDGLDVSFVVSLVRYLKEYQDGEVSSLFLEMSESPRGRVAEEAIKALGGAKKDTYAEKLRTIYEEAADNRTRKEAALEALGEIRSEKTLPLLEKIVLDEDEEKGLRWKAAIALGNIGNEEALEVLIETLQEDEPRLRQFAVRAMGNFSEKEEITEALIEALKDNSWRVRVEAAESLGKMGAGKAVDILRYKAEYDPDTHNVGRAAVRALGKIGKNGAHEYLEELYEDASTPLEIRATAIDMLIEHNLSDSVKTIEKTIAEEWDKENSRILDFTCKKLSQQKDGALKPLFKKMLNHPSSLNIKIYGLRGIRLNNFSGLKEEVEKLSQEGNASSLRRLALTVLEEL